MARKDGNAPKTWRISTRNGVVELHEGTRSPKGHALLRKILDRIDARVAAERKKARRRRARSK